MRFGGRDGVYKNDDNHDDDNHDDDDHDDDGGDDADAGMMISIVLICNSLFRMAF